MKKGSLPRSLPAALIALAPIADGAALVLEPPPFATRLGKRRLVASVEHENDEIERVVRLAGFGAGKPDQHGRGVWILEFARQKDRLFHRIPPPPPPPRGETTGGLGPHPALGER